MSPPRHFIVIGATGLVGSAIASHLHGCGHDVTRIDSSNYAACVGAAADVVINANGNTYRFKANEDPRWDFGASVQSVHCSLFDFKADLYVYVSSIDVYHDRANAAANSELTPIDFAALDSYGFHKWVAERLVQKFARRSIVARCGTAIGPGLKKGPVFDIINRQRVHMSPDSTLSLIHTDEVARAFEILVGLSAPPPIVNVTGTGSVSVAELANIAGLGLSLAPRAEESVHRYDINNQLLRDVIAVGSSRDMAQRFFNDWAAHHT